MILIEHSSILGRTLLTTSVTPHAIYVFVNFLIKKDTSNINFHVVLAFPEWREEPKNYTKLLFVLRMQHVQEDREERPTVGVLTRSQRVRTQRYEAKG